jgi:hypothetical protein
MPLKHVQIVIFLANLPRTPKKWAIAHEKVHECKNNEFSIMPPKHVLSVMSLVNHPENPRLWAIAHETARNAKTMSFWSCLSNMY